MIGKTDKELISEHIKDSLEMERNNNLKDIKAEIEQGKYGGVYVRSCGKCYYVVGATSTTEDYYYVCLNNDRDLHFISCVGKLDVLEEPPINMSILDWLIQHEPDYLAEHVKEEIDKLKTDVLFTKVNINGTLY